jgi:hypothetical protein
MRSEPLEHVVAEINLKSSNSIVVSEEAKPPIYSKRKLTLPQYQGHNIWILKATGFNRGRGIHVVTKIEDIKSLIREYTEGVNLEY